MTEARKGRRCALIDLAVIVLGLLCGVALLQGTIRREA